MWQKQDASSGSGGWMVRIDDTGVYHGTDQGVVKYDLTGKQVWEQRADEVHSVLFGCQVR